MKILRNTLILLLLLVFAIPVFAQDVSPVVIDIDTDEIITMFSGLGVVVAIGGIFILGLRVIEALKISVPVEALQSIGNLVVTTAREKLQETEKMVKESPGQTDDFLFNLAHLPLAALLSEVERRTNTVSSDISPLLDPVNYGIPINPNYNFAGKISPDTWGGHRTKHVPDTWSLIWQQLVDDDDLGPPPEVEVSNAELVIAMSHRRGLLILEQHQAIEKQRYLIKVRGRVDLNPKPGYEDLVSQYISISIRITDDNGIDDYLPKYFIIEPKGTFEEHWVIESQNFIGELRYQILLMVGDKDNVPFDDNSKVIYEEISLAPTASVYSEDSVFRF